MLELDSSRSRAVLTLGPAVLAAALYAPTLGNPLLYDDPGLFEWLRTVTGAAQFLAPESEPGRSLSYLSVYLEMGLWGDWIPGYRITNLLLHGLNSALAALVAGALTGRFFPALVCGLLFAAHPVHVEAVASIENRKDLLSTALALGAVLAYLRLRNPWRVIAPIVLGALAMVAKDVVGIGLMVVLPAAALLFTRADSGLRVRRALWLAVPVFVIGVAATFALAGPLARYYEPVSISIHTEGLCRSYPEVLAHSAGALAGATRLLVFPARLSADYEGASDREARLSHAPLGIAILLAALIALALALRRDRTIAFALIWMGVMYAPVANLVPLTHFFLAERYLYAPSFGLCLAVGWALDRLRSRPHARAELVASALAALLVVVGAARSVARTLEWRDGVTLWTADARRAGEPSARVEAMLAQALAGAGQAEASLPHFEAALSANPRHVFVRIEYGRALRAAGRESEGTAQLRAAQYSFPRGSAFHREIEAELSAGSSPPR